MLLKLRKLFDHSFADVVAPKWTGGERDVFYDPIGGASGITHTLSATGRYEDVIPGGHQTGLVDDAPTDRVRRFAHHHFARVNVLEQLRRKAVDWYADHFLARDVTIREIGNGKHYAHSHLTVPMGASRRAAIRQTCEEFDRVSGEKRLLYVHGGPTATRRKL